MMKKIFCYLLVLLFPLCNVSLVFADGFGDTTYVQNLGGLPGTDKPEATGGSLITVIKNAINWILGFLATIALILCLWAGFQMVTATGEEKKYENGLKILKQAAIGLAIIGLSWIIVSAIFWIIRGVTA